MSDELRVPIEPITQSVIKARCVAVGMMLMPEPVRPDLDAIERNHFPCRVPHCDTHDLLAYARELEAVVAELQDRSLSWNHKYVEAENRARALEAAARAVCEAKSKAMDTPDLIHVLDAIRKLRAVLEGGAG